MSVYRLTDPNPTYVNLLGTEAAPGGSLTFYDLGTTTPKTTWADFAKTTPNANPVTLDAAGRAATEIWLDGDYTAVLNDADDTEVWTRDVRPEVAPGLALPDPVGNDGKVVVAAGAGYVLEERRQLPDPTGSGTYMLVANADGTDYILQAQPVPEEIVIPEPDWDVTGGDLHLGSFLIQQGEGQATASNSEAASVAVAFAQAFDSAPRVFIQVKNITTASGHALVAHSVTGTSTTGFTARFNIADRHYVDGSKITSNIPFDYFAVGVKA